MFRTATQHHEQIQRRFTFNSTVLSVPGENASMFEVYLVMKRNKILSLSLRILRTVNGCPVNYAPTISVSILAY